MKLQEQVVESNEKTARDRLADVLDNANDQQNKKLSTEIVTSMNDDTQILNKLNSMETSFKELSLRTETALRELATKNETALKELSSKTEIALRELATKNETALKELSLKTETALKELSSKTEISNLKEVMDSKLTALDEKIKAEGSGVRGLVAGFMGVGVFIGAITLGLSFYNTFKPTQTLSPPAGYAIMSSPSSPSNLATVVDPLKKP